MATPVDKPPDPLRVSTQIVNQGGYPTPQFIRQWNQQRIVNVTVDDIVVDLTALEADVSQNTADIAALETQVDTNTDDIADIQDVDIVAGTDLSGGGNISGPSDVTIDHEDTAVTPGTYGNTTNVPQITVNQRGHITSAVNVPITGGGSGSGSGGGGSLGSTLVYLTSAKAGINPSAGYAVPWDAADHDSLGLWSAGAPTLFTVPALLDGGYIVFSAGLNVGNIGAGNTFLFRIQQDTGGGFGQAYPGAASIFRLAGTSPTFATITTGPDRS